MARKPRSILPEHATFHVTARGVEQRRIVLDDVDRRRLVSLIRVAERIFAEPILAYCVLGNHFHLIVDTRLENLSVGMHRLCFRHAQAFNQRHGRTGHLFQGRFYSRVIAEDQHLRAACDYVLDNAVRAGLCPSREDWPWLGGLIVER